MHIMWEKDGEAENEKVTFLTWLCHQVPQLQPQYRCRLGANVLLFGLSQHWVQVVLPLWNVKLLLKLYCVVFVSAGAATTWNIAKDKEGDKMLINYSILKDVLE